MGKIIIANLSISQIVAFNPVLQDSSDVREEYLKRLGNYFSVCKRKKRKYDSAAFHAYEKFFADAKETIVIHDINYYQYFILFDLAHIFGYNTMQISGEALVCLKKLYQADFPQSNDSIVNKIFQAFSVDDMILRRLKHLENNTQLTEELKYIQKIEQNLKYKEQKPFRILVTATMSAGKSTFINALIGKQICLSKNMACTSQIKTIINKAFEDGYSSIYDHYLNMTATNDDVLNTDKSSASDKTFLSTSFGGVFDGRRLMLIDSPGVNNSQDDHHKRLTYQFLKRRKYDLVVYLMNAEVLETNDASEFLTYIKQTIGKTPILFVINKVDLFDADEDKIEDKVGFWKDYICSFGFKNPLICPISSRAGYLAKKIKHEQLSLFDELDFYNYVYKFEKMGLRQYYQKSFPNIKVENVDKEEQLIATSGIAYVEKIIISLGGKSSDTIVRKI